MITRNDIPNLQRLHGTKKPLTEMAAAYAVRMKAKLPEESIQPGKVYQLAGKQLHGVDCLILLVIPDKRALVIDISTGVVGSIDTHGNESVNQIGKRP